MTDDIIINWLNDTKTFYKSKLKEITGKTYRHKTILQLNIKIRTIQHLINKRKNEIGENDA